MPKVLLFKLAVPEIQMSKTLEEVCKAPILILEIQIIALKGFLTCFTTDFD